MEALAAAMGTSIGVIYLMAIDDKDFSKKDLETFHGVKPLLKSVVAKFVGVN